MTINLSHKYYCWWNALLAWALRIRSVIILAVIVDFIPSWWYKGTIRALRVFRMWLDTLLTTFSQVRIERYMFDIWNFLFFWFSWSWWFLDSVRCWLLFAHSINLHWSVRAGLGANLLHIFLDLLLNCCHNNIAVSHKNNISVFYSSLRQKWVIWRLNPFLKCLVCEKCHNFWIKIESFFELEIVNAWSVYLLEV